MYHELLDQGIDPTDSETGLEELIAKGKELYEAELAVKRAEREQADQVRREQLEAQWQPILDLIRGNIPSVLHQYLEWPRYHEPTYFKDGDYHLLRFRTVQLRLPGVAPIEIFGARNGTEQELAYRVAAPQLAWDDENYGWDVKFDLCYAVSNSNPFPIKEITVAIFMATEMGPEIADLEAEAKRRNDMVEFPTASERQDDTPSPIELAKRFAEDANGELGNTSQEHYAMVLATLAQTYAMLALVEKPYSSMDY